MKLNDHVVWRESPLVRFPDCSARPSSSSGGAKETSSVLAYAAPDRQKRAFHHLNRIVAVCKRCCSGYLCFRKSEDFFRHHSTALRSRLRVARGEIHHAQCDDTLRFGRESEHIEPIVPIIINLHSASSEALKKRFQNNRTKNWSLIFGNERVASQLST
jgi:hypothetical protein